MSAKKRAAGQNMTIDNFKTVEKVKKMSPKKKVTGRKLMSRYCVY
jgi:hypothetical protein